MLWGNFTHPLQWMPDNLKLMVITPGFKKKDP